MKNFLDLHLISSNDLKNIINNALNIKIARKGYKNGKKDDDVLLSDICIGLIFEKPSTRTRVSFEVGIKQMGGTSLVLTSSDIHLGKNENVSDTSKVLSRYLDLLMIRTFDHNNLIEFSKSSSIPVINGLTNFSHPCQVLADIMTFNELRGNISNKKVVWIGPANNVFNSYVHASKKFNFNLFFCGPEELKPEAEILLWAKKNKEIFFENNPLDAVKEANLIVTDTQISMHEENIASENRRKLLKKFQVNQKLMSLVKEDTLFMHCLPAHRNKEVTDEVMDGKHSVVFDVAENRLHIQKSILKWCLGF